MAAIAECPKTDLIIAKNTLIPGQAEPEYSPVTSGIDAKEIDRMSESYRRNPISLTVLNTEVSPY